MEPSSAISVALGPTLAHSAPTVLIYIIKTCSEPKELSAGVRQAGGCDRNELCNPLPDPGRR